MTRLALAAVAALLSASAQAAEPPILDLYYSGASVGAGRLVPTTIEMGLDAVGRAYPCGSSSVVFGCGMNVPPLNAASNLVPGTVAAANTFQLAIAANASRRGCLVVNKSQAPLMVALTVPASATPAAAIMLSPGTATTDGGKMSCAVGSGVVVSDAISVTSTTAGAAFLVIWQ